VRPMHNRLLARGRLVSGSGWSPRRGSPSKKVRAIRYPQGPPWKCCRCPPSTPEAIPGPHPHQPHEDSGEPSKSTRRVRRSAGCVPAPRSADGDRGREVPSLATSLTAMPNVSPPRFGKKQRPRGHTEEASTRPLKCRHRFGGWPNCETPGHRGGGVRGQGGRPSVSGVRGEPVLRLEPGSLQAL
jgi:hypothetical protein